MPRPKHLKTLSGYVGRWIEVTKALPPERAGVLVMIRGDNCPAYAWLKFAAGCKDSPYFVCPQRAAMEPRGAHITAPQGTAYRQDVTLWFAPMEHGLPSCPLDNDWRTKKWGLGGSGWESWEPPRFVTAIDGGVES